MARLNTASQVPASPPGVHEVDEPLRVRHRQRPEQQLPDDRRDRGVGPEAERERQHRDGGEHGRAGERAGGVAERGHGEPR
jgi:hypothetical protein